MSKQKKQKRRELPAIQWEKVADREDDALVAYALLAGTPLPPVNVDEEEDS